jgi:hypothetical protein
MLYIIALTSADKHMARLEEGWAEELTTAKAADLLVRTAVACRGREGEDASENSSADAAKTGTVDLYRFRTRRVGSAGTRGKGYAMTHHSSVEELVKSLETEAG